MPMKKNRWRTQQCDPLHGQPLSPQLVITAKAGLYAGELIVVEEIVLHQGMLFHKVFHQ